MISLPTLLSLTKEVILPSKEGFIEIKLGKNFVMQFYDRPGEHCSPAELKQLVDDLRSVYSKSMPGPIPEYGVLKGELEDLKNRVITLIRTPEGKPVAFCAQARLPVTFGQISHEVIHLGLVAVDPDYRKMGLQGVLYSLPVLYLFFKGGLSYLYFTNVTQVPAIIGQCEDYFFDVYPSSKNNTEQSFHHHRIALTIFERYKSVFGVGENSTYLPHQQIIQNSYTGGSDSLKKTFDQSAKHRRAEVNDFCENNLDYDRGDDFIQIGLMDYRCFFLFFKSRHQNIFSKIILESVVWSLQTIVVPTLKWVING